MSLPVPVVWSEDCLRHEPAGEVWLGLREPGTEVPARALVLRDALTAAGAPVTAARRHDDTILRRVHDPALLGHLASVWEDWEAAGLPAGHGRDRVVPYVFPTPGLLAGLPPRIPPAVHGRAGLYCYDTMTLAPPSPPHRDLSAGRLAYALAVLLGITPAARTAAAIYNAAVAAEALRAAGAARSRSWTSTPPRHGPTIFWDRADAGTGRCTSPRGLSRTTCTPASAAPAGPPSPGPAAPHRTPRCPCAPRKRRVRPVPWMRRPPTRKVPCRCPRPGTARPGRSRRWPPRS